MTSEKMNAHSLGTRLQWSAILVFVASIVPLVIEGRKGFPPYWLQMDQQEVIFYKARMGVFIWFASICIGLSILLFAYGVWIKWTSRK